MQYVIITLPSAETLGSELNFFFAKNLYSLLIFLTVIDMWVIPLEYGLILFFFILGEFLNDNNSIIDPLESFNLIVFTFTYLYKIFLSIC